MRYGIAIMVGVALMVIAQQFVWHADRFRHRALRQGFHAGREQSETAPEPDAQGSGDESLGIDIPAREMFLMDIADLIRVWRFVLFPAILIGSLGVAWLLGLHRASPSSDRNLEVRSQKIGQ